MKRILALLALLPLVSFGQATWSEIATPTNENLKTIQFVNEHVGYIGGEEVLLKTMDGGANWNVVSIDSIALVGLSTLDIFDMHWFNENHGMIMSGVWGGMFETMDGGANWVPVYPANSGFCQFSSLFFFNENNGFAGGAGCFEGRIIDRFENGVWSVTNDPQDWDTNNWVSCIEFMNQDTGFAGTANGSLLRTIDGGLNWDTITNPTAGQMITDFAFYGDGMIRATHHNQQWGVMISNDHGLTWDWDPETATFFYPQMDAAHIDAAGTTYLGGIESNSGLYGVIFDNSAGWWNYGNVGARVNDITSISDSTTFLVCDSGQVYVNVPPSTLSIQDPYGGAGFEVWPNPCNDLINISIGDRKGHLIEVFDMTGMRVISRTVQSTLSTVEIAELSAGIYLVRVDAFGAGRLIVKE